MGFIQDVKDHDRRLQEELVRHHATPAMEATSWRTAFFWAVMLIVAGILYWVAS